MLPSAIERLIDSIELEVKSHVKNDLSDAMCNGAFGRYSPDSIDRKIFPYIDVRNTGYLKDMDYMDDRLLAISQDYASSLQRSVERRLVDSHLNVFDSTSMDKRLSKAENAAFLASTMTTYAASAVLIACGISLCEISSQYPGLIYIGGMFSAFIPAIFVERWHHPLGRLVMNLSYNEKSMLGTNHHEDDLKKQYIRRLDKYARKIGKRHLSHNTLEQGKTKILENKKVLEDKKILEISYN